MQIVFLPKWMMVASYFIVWPLINLAMSTIVNGMDDSLIDPGSFIFRTRKWEDGGRFYSRVFRVKKWKGLLPDGASISKRGLSKRNLESTDREYLEEFVKDTCRAELIHYLEILPFWIFGLWSPPVVIPYMLAYALAVNIPCIISQRYNRPRLTRLIDSMK